MTRYFLGVSQEQFPPEDLLRQAIAAEQEQLRHGTLPSRESE